MRKIKCASCGETFNARHFNQKYHNECAEKLKKKPKGKLEDWQEEIVRLMAGEMPYEKLAEMVGCSRSNLTRWARNREDVSLNSLKYKENVIDEVCAYYEKHGRVKTEQEFKNAKVRSIVERYKRFKPRQIRWTDEQIVELVRFSPWVPFKKQAEYFNRPNANAGSIRSFWVKRLGMYPGKLHGLPANKAYLFVDKDCPFIRHEYMRTESANKSNMRKICLWVDMKKHLKKDCPAFVKDAVLAMSEFQVWLYGKNPKKAILKLKV